MRSLGRSAVVRQEVIKLSALIVLAVALFAATWRVAASNHDTRLRDAAEWYRRGEQAIAAGRTDEAIDALRRATARDRDERRYGLAFAQALTVKRDDDAARAVLLTLRESSPEDAAVNLQLARLAAARADLTEAPRYYHSALYAPWPLEQAGARRQVRTELVQFLLTHGQQSRALAELLALSADLPDEATPRLEAARLFTDAGDSAHALDQCQRALHAAPEDQAAIACAGKAAFALGDYILADRYLRRLPVDSGEVLMRDVVGLVVSNDPLASRIGAAERRRRLVDNVAYVRQRLVACEATSSTRAPDVVSNLQDEARSFEQQLTRSRTLEQDTVERGLDLIDREERELARSCGAQTARDQALTLIGRRHGAGGK